MKRNSFILMMLIAFSALMSVSVQLDVNPSAWNVSTRGHKQAVLMEPGNPELPFYPIQILVPFGEKVQSVSVQLFDLETVARSVELNYVRHQQPTSLPTPDLTVRNLEVWNSDSMYPSRDFDYLGTQFFRGYQLAIINVYPWRYNPIQKEIIAASRIEVSIESSFDSATASQQANFVTYNQQTRLDLQRHIQNSEAIASYASASAFRTHTPRSRLIDLSSPKFMIIITDQTRAPWFDEYVMWRNSEGVDTGVFTTNDIYAEYEGVDNADKVRNFIIDAYQSWAEGAITLEYVILGGDDEIVPERGARGQVGQTTDNRMPTDIYFSNLDGDWNANGNNVYGEVTDNVDMIPEVHIGRFPAETLNEFNNMFRKTRHYVENNDYTNNIALMIGENLNWNPLTWGGDYKDDVALHIPDTYHISTLYQRDGNYNGTIVWDAINSGANVMNHMGHANESTLMGQAINTVNSLQNDKYGFLYTQGCYPAAFDQRTSGDGESIGEHFAIASSALFAFIGNTRYGWYAPGSINGASQFYDRDFFIGMYDEGQTELGKALTYSRLANLNAALASDVMRWCYYEVVLFGDPSISVKMPDAAMPLLGLHSYSIDDSEGDNDGTLNPGEIIRIHPRLTNHPDWHLAQNISVFIEGLPGGSTLLSDSIVISELAPGEISSEDIYFRIQLGESLSFGNYSVTLVVESMHPQTGLSTGQRRFKIDFSITLLDSRFPWESDFATKSAPVVYDFDDDGSLDILYLDVFGGGHLIGNDGTEFDSFSTNGSLNINRSYALGDIDGDGTLDLAISSRTGDVIAMKIDGTELYSYQTETQILGTPVLADIDGDGSLDLVVAGLNRNVYVFNPDGSIHSGFPFQVAASIPSELAVADLDSDGSMEIICGTVTGLLYVIQSDGTVRNGFPLQLSGSITGSPTVLNNNRIVCGTNTMMYLVEPDGSIVFEKPITAELAGGAVVADMNGDGNVEIIAVTSMGMLYNVDQMGNDLPGYPVNINEYFTCPPLVADVNSDSNYEIILHSYINAVHIYRADGTPLGGFPFPTAFNGATPASLVDFDNDGYFKLVTGFSTGILVVNLRRPASELTPWVTYRGGLSRQGSFAATGYVSNQDLVQIPQSMVLNQNYPNPFNPQTTISFNLDKASRARLRIYNTKGQLVKDLLATDLAAGRHQVVWNGKDERGHNVSTGIYFYKLEAAGQTQMRKMLLLK